ncbi:hypothetical protein [Sporisorium scitamineum]|uniref:Uncharacterized protein n=1 Tax=Sporisorium scitamineum TaxID=49012 RepID=A0A0F7RXB3_9BASI|nr:hypothetical protein [Sporisorium scitamineum]
MSWTKFLVHLLPHNLAAAAATAHGTGALVSFSSYPATEYILVKSVRRRPSAV